MTDTPPPTPEREDLAEKLDYLADTLVFNKQRHVARQAAARIRELSAEPTLGSVVAWLRERGVSYVATLHDIEVALGWLGKEPPPEPYERYQRQTMLVTDLRADSAAKDARIRELEGALRGLTDFAWSAVAADCDESRDYLNGKLAVARSLLKSGAE